MSAVEQRPPRPPEEEGGEFAWWDERRRCWLVHMRDPKTKRWNDVGWDPDGLRWLRLRELDRLRREGTLDMTVAEAAAQIEAHCFSPSRWGPSAKTKRALRIVLAAARHSVVMEAEAQIHAKTATRPQKGGPS